MRGGSERGEWEGEWEGEWKGEKTCGERKVCVKVNSTEVWWECAGWRCVGWRVHKECVYEWRCDWWRVEVCMQVNLHE